MRNIDLIREVARVAAGQWPFVLAGLNINVPDSPRRHSACPACGGKDRFRFDDDGRGSFICNQCGAGDGLDLIKKVNRCNTTTAAQMVADVLAVDYRKPTVDPIAANHRRKQLEADYLQRERERQQKATADTAQRRNQFTRRYQTMREKAVQRESNYLRSKGLAGFIHMVMPDGSLLLPLVDEYGDITAAQTITIQGVKRLLAGSTKCGVYHAINVQEAPQTLLITEGLATALSVHLMRPDTLAVMAVDAGNLLHVAKLIRRRYPEVQIIIAADNDQHPDTPNTGKDAAEKAAIAVNGWVSMPPGHHKTDWNDIHQHYGLETASQAFAKSLYKPERK